MGLRVVVSDMNPEAPGRSLADDFLAVSTYDVAGTVASARNYHQNRRRIAGVMCMATDVPLTVASVAEDLGLPGIPVKSAELAMDKLAMKDRFARDGVAIPWYRSIESAQELEEIVRTEGRSLVIKPVDSRGARGVLKLSSIIDLDWAFATSCGYSPTGRVMVERFLEGPQLSTESIVVGGKCHTVGFADRNYEFLDKYAPYIIENGGDLPAAISPDIKERVEALITLGAQSLGIMTGVVKGDIVIHEGEPHIIELAARLSGGYFCSHLIPLSTGVDFVGTAINLALGNAPEPSALQNRFLKGVSQRYLFPEPGRVVSVYGVREVASWPEIKFCEVRVRIGDMVAQTEHHPSRAGLLIAVAAERDTATCIAEKAISRIRIETRG